MEGWKRVGRMTSRRAFAGFYECVQLKLESLLASFHALGVFTEDAFSSLVSAVV